MPKTRSLRDRVLANWPIKLTALVLAMVLWAVVAAEETTTQLVPIALEIQPPEGRALISELPEVQARYGGTLRELLKLYETPPTIRKTIPDTTTGSTYTLQLSPEELEVENAEVKAQEIQPSTITVQLDDFLQRTVPVVARVVLLPNSGFERFGDIEISPASVTLRGPAALVTPIRSVRTMPMERRGITDPVRFFVRIDTSSLGDIVRVDPSQVQVTADFGRVLDKVLMGVAVSVRSGRGVWETDPSAVTVTVHGPSARIIQLTRDSVRVVAQPDASGAETMVPLVVIAPPGIHARAIPESTLVRRRGGG